jgi:hypothetical protein
LRSINYSAIENIELKNVEVLDISNINNIRISNINNIKYISIQNCNNCIIDLKNADKLLTLYIEYNNVNVEILNLKDSINLINLKIDDAKYLQYLPDLINLEILILKGITELEPILNNIKNLKKLTHVGVEFDVYSKIPHEILDKYHIRLLY